jgi:hypothetical protein
MFDIAELLAEYDRARAYTDQLWRDLTEQELHWRPERNFSPIGWHLGHQAHVAHFMVRNLTAAEPPAAAEPATTRRVPRHRGRARPCPHAGHRCR